LKRREEEETQDVVERTRRRHKKDSLLKGGEQRNLGPAGKREEEERKSRPPFDVPSGGKEKGFSGLDRGPQSPRPESFTTTRRRVAEPASRLQRKLAKASPTTAIIQIYRLFVKAKRENSGGSNSRPRKELQLLMRAQAKPCWNRRRKGHGAAPARRKKRAKARKKMALTGLRPGRRDGKMVFGKEDCR